MKIYYTTSDNGDGSASVEFFASQECIDFLEENDPEGYGAGEGGGWIEIDGTVTGSCYSNFELKTLEQVKADWEKWNS